MSKCDCCKEENSNLITYKGYKMCPDCYMGYVRKVKVCENNAKYETEIDQLKQQLAKKDCRIEELEGQFAYECECNKQLVELQKQLEEKQNTIDEINKEFVQAVHDWKALCAKKDEEIEDCKRNELYEENMKILAVKNQTQLAIQELEKVKEKIDCEMAIREYDISEQTVDVCVLIAEQIDHKIKKLKGE